MGEYVKFFVKVEGIPVSAHRSPEGIYHVDVIDGIASMKQCAGAALCSAINNIPFLLDDLSRFSLRLFSNAGEEINAKTSVPVHVESLACYCGKTKEYPETIN